MAVIPIAVLSSLYVARWGWLKYQYPYGASHSCDKALMAGLMQYAEKHDGKFPVGESSPEASLSLLYRGSSFCDAEILRGKTVPRAVVQERLDRGELLSPETCGWHYVEGLTLADDHRLALFWDKVGLGHNGQRLGGSHLVWFVGFDKAYITQEQWPRFLAEQQQLLAARTDAAKRGLPALTARIRLPSGELVDEYEGAYRLDEISTSGRSGKSGRKLRSKDLRCGLAHVLWALG